METGHRFMAFQRTLYTAARQATNDVHAHDPIRVPSTINRISSRKPNTQPSLILWQIDPMLLQATTLCMGNARRCQQRPLPAQRRWRGDLSVRNKHGADGVVATDPALLPTARHVADMNQNGGISPIDMSICISIYAMIQKRFHAT